jgi:hypothetical protein
MQDGEDSPRRRSIMNAYTSMGQARIQPRDFSAVLRANQLAGAPLAVFERQRGCQADAELNWLLKRNGVTSNASASRVALVRQTIGTALVRVRERITGISPSGASPEPVSVVGPFGTVG